ncbi:MAG: TFIIB-type zinc ribbon-containing protein [Bifidobacteriaceae bacterium]|nr:TFIIB-type zinc ribbon-containing protein [Bifidobacteriaceae bacterium]
MSQAVDYKCPNCGGSLVYDAASGAMVCGNCGSRFDPAQFQTPWAADAVPPVPPAPPAEPAAGSQPAFAQAFSPETFPWPGLTDVAGAAPAWPPNELSEYTCRSCGAVVVADPTSAAGSCPYCRSPIVIADQMTGALAPDLVIPFVTSRDQAVEALKKLYLGKRLLPKVFSTQNFIDEVKGVYVPFWLFDFDTQVIERYVAEDVHTRSAGSKRYVTTRRFSAVRMGDARFTGIPADGSVNMPDAIMESIEPFDLSQARVFGPAYLAGFLAERYDVDSRQAFDRANQRVNQSAGTIFANTVTGHQTVSGAGSEVRIRDLRVHYGLLPVWMLTTIWRGQRFTFAMNGQTGRMVGDLPLDRQAYWRWFGALASICAVVGGAVTALVVAL